MEQKIKLEKPGTLLLMICRRSLVGANRLLRKYLLGKHMEFKDHRQNVYMASWNFERAPRE